MRGDRALSRCILLFLGLGLSAARGGPDAPEGEDLLRFADGSALHGQLSRIDPGQGLRWRSAAASAPIDFQPGHLDAVRFAHADILKLTPTCHLRLANGDDLFGALTSLDGSALGFTTWFGDKITLPRAAAQSVTFLSSNYAILYEGPFDQSGWVSPPSPSGWLYQDGAFYATGPGRLGREFHLTNSCTVEFDLTWAGFLDLLVSVYSDSPDRVDFNGNSYVAQISREQVSLQRLRPNAAPFNLGAVPLPASAASGRRVHVTLQINAGEGAVDLLMDGVIVKHWKDDDNLGAAGGAIIFEQRLPGATVKLGALRISSWEGRPEPESLAPATNSDYLRFINRDKAGGKIVGIDGGKVAFALGTNLLTIPLERLTQIHFAPGTNAAPAPTGPWSVRAFFPGGGAVSFELEKWDATGVAGRSPVFGPLAFQPGSIRELQFNLGRPRPETLDSPTNEFEGLDE